MKDKEINLEEIESSHTLGVGGKGRVQGRGNSFVRHTSILKSHRFSQRVGLTTMVCSVCVCMCTCVSEDRRDGTGVVLEESSLLSHRFFLYFQEE